MCDKVKFKSRNSAKKWIKAKHRVFNGGRMRIYACSLCHNFHLTKTNIIKG